MNELYKPKLTYAICAFLVVLGACMASDTNPSSKTPEKANSASNSSAPVELESVKAAQNGINPQPIPPRSVRSPKPVGIVLRHVHAVQIPGGQVVLVVPDRYLSDLTNLYPSQVVEVLRLEEP